MCGTAVAAAPQFAFTRFVMSAHPTWGAETDSREESWTGRKGRAGDRIRAERAEGRKLDAPPKLLSNREVVARSKMLPL